MKRTLAFLLSLTMVLSMLPATVLAAANPPRNPRWDTDSELTATWDYPEGATEDTLHEYIFDIIFYYSESPDGPWTVADSFDDWEKGNYVLLQSHVVAQYGCGYYKFKVRCSDTSKDGESEWVESDVYHLNFSGVQSHAPQPGVGGLNYDTDVLEWEESETSSQYTSIIEVWYMGTDATAPEAQWERVDRVIAGATSSYALSNIIYPGKTRDWEAGWYAFKVIYFPENYLECGESAPRLLDYEYELTHATPLPAPTGVVWTEDKTVLWDLPDDLTGYDYYDVEILYSETQLDDPAASWVTADFFSCSAEILLSPEVWEEVGYMSHAVIRDNGEGWYYFRVKACAADSSVNSDSNWAYSGGVQVAPVALAIPTELEWHRYYTDNGANYTTEAGRMSFRMPEGSDPHDHVLHLYQVNENGDDIELTDIYGYSFAGNYVSRSASSSLTPGCSYYYTVQARGDGVNTSDGPVATSVVWKFAPANTLAVSDVKWDPDTMQMLWSTSNSDAIAEMEIQLFFTNAQGEMDEDNVIANYTAYSNEAFFPHRSDLQFVDGWYYFRVRAVSGDLLNYANSDWVLSDGFYYTAPTNKAPAPTNLAWDVEQGDNYTRPNPGCMSFRGVEDTQYELTVYRKGEYNDQQIFRTSLSCWTGWCNFDYFAGSPDNCVTGTYYFTAQAKGDGISSSDSDLVTSDEWTYTRPEKVLSATNLGWDGLTLDFEAETDLIKKYEVDFYFNATADSPSQSYYVYSENYESDELPMTLPASVLDEHGDGWYYYKVMLCTTDITKAVSSNDSAFSSAFHYTKPDKTLDLTNPQWTGDGRSMAWSHSFAGASDYVDRYEVRIYYSSSADTLPDVNDWVDWEAFTPDDSSRMSSYVLEQYGTGWYYFTVRAVAKDPMTANTGAWTGFSNAFAYTEPELTLTVSDLKWEDMSPTWTDGFDSTAPVDCYALRYYYGKTAETIDYNSNIDGDSLQAEDLPAILPTGLLREYGEGYYAFKVRVYSADTTQALSGEWSAASPAYHFEGPSATAAPATDPQWHLWRWEEGDSDTEIGAISFGGTVPEGADYAEYQVTIYRKTDSGDVSIGSTRAYLEAGDDYTCFQPFDNIDFSKQFTTGTYYFTVTALGDGVNTGDGSTVTSGNWAYTRPSAQLEVSDPVWNSDMSASWTDGASGQAAYYDLHFQYVGPNDTFCEDDWHDTLEYWPEDGKAFPSDWILQEFGSGKYYFRVRAMPADVTQALSSAWSEWSEAFDYTKPSITLTATDLQWNEETLGMTWNLNSDTALVDYYRIRFYYSETSALPDTHKTTYTFTPDEAPFTLPGDVISNYGSGYYWFKVRVYSADSTKAFSGDWSEVSAPLYYAGASEKLGTPTELMWHKEVVIHRNNGQITDYTFVDRKGSIAFKRALDENGAFADQARYQVYIYEEGNDEPVSSSNINFGSSNIAQYRDTACFIYSDLPSGTYYFKVRTRGDNINYNHGDWVTSDSWTYEKPTEQLPAPTGLVWNDTDYTDWEGNLPIAGCWEPVEGAGYYEMDFLFAENENRTPEYCGGYSDLYADDDPYDFLDDDLLSDYGKGLYYFRVRAIPADITEVSASEWSELSPAYDMRDTVDRVNGALDALLPSTGEDAEAPTADVIQQTVSQIDLLDEAMAADAAKGTSGTLAKLAELETLVKEELDVNTKVAVSEDLVERFGEGLDQNSFTAVNMILNVDVDAAKESDETTTVQLNISDAESNTELPEDLIDTQKNNTMVFSMSIENTVDADPDTTSMDLKIPVQITLPIPKDINRAFLVILHQKSNGDWEELFLPHVFQKNGQWYATFNVTSFSNYAMGEQNITAKADSNTVTVDAHLPTSGKNTQYLCAVYSSTHQLLGMDILQPQAEEALVITLETDVPAGAYLKIFAPDTGDGWAIHSDAAKVNID